MKQFINKIGIIYTSYSGYRLPLLFSLFILLGNSYRTQGSWNLCFGSFGQFALFLLLLCIIAVFLKFFLGLCFIGLDYLGQDSSYGNFLQSHVILKVMILLIIFWLPYLLASFPGTLCIDSQTQLNQIYGYAPYSLHHPMLHTLLMGLFVKGGHAILGSANIGFFAYIGVQSLYLSFAFAFSIWAMCQKKSHKLWIYITLSFYCITPLFGYYASLAIKDTPFNSSFLIFMVCFILLWEKASFKFLPYLLTASAVLVCQFRNNGIYLIGLVALLLIVLLIKQKLGRERLQTLFLPIAAALLLHFLINAVIAIIYHPLPGYSREMLSIFMQQTARYVSTYGHDITAQEEIILENIFGNIDALSANYNPHLSDPVKNMFKMNASGNEIIAYLKVWFSQFWRHPDAYFEAFFHGSFGWFYPFVDNAERYYDPGFIFTNPTFTANMKHGVFWWYDTFRKIPGLNLLQNVGFYTWLMFTSISYILSRAKKQIIFFMPLLLVLLICLAAPAFFQHARYGFPILFCMPLLIGVITTPSDSNFS